MRHFLAASFFAACLASFAAHASKASPVGPGSGSCQPGFVLRTQRCSTQQILNKSCLPAWCEKKAGGRGRSVSRGGKKTCAQPGSKVSVVCP